ncbi:MAG: hypothetical protein R6U17_00085 [Thermoplasmata archaeon]
MRKLDYPTIDGIGRGILSSECSGQRLRFTQIVHPSAVVSHKTSHIAISISGFGTYIAFEKALKVRRNLLDSLPFDSNLDIIKNEVGARKYFSNVSLVMGSITFIDTPLIGILIYIFGIPNDVINKAAIGCLPAVSSMFFNLGRSMIF